MSRRPPPRRLKRRPPPRRHRIEAKPAPAPEPPVRAASGHVRRVTLNLLRHAACCPDELRPVLDRLPELGWNIAGLPGADLELLYALVTDELTAQVVGEFTADTRSIVDMVRLKYPKDERHCKLCGHPHNRWEFTLHNHAGGRDCKVGSQCIITYGLNVDGELTAEAALAKLQRAIADAKREYEREQWQAEHPDHATQIEALRAMGRVLGTWVSYRVMQGCQPEFQKRRKGFRKKAKAIVKYYNANGFLTPLRTGQMFGTDDHPGMLAIGGGMVAELQQAQQAQDPHRAHWDAFIERHSKTMTPYQARKVEGFRAYGNHPERMRPWQHQLIEEIVLRTKRIETAEPDPIDIPDTLPF